SVFLSAQTERQPAVRIESMSPLGCDEQTSNVQTLQISGQCKGDSASTQKTTTGSSAQPSAMNLISIYERQDRCLLLFKLLAERDDTVNISHSAMPTWEQHIKFVDKKPYEKWFFGLSGDTVVGACYLTKQNEIGIFVFKEFQGKG